MTNISRRCCALTSYTGVWKMHSRQEEIFMKSVNGERKAIQHVYCVGAKSLGAYGGYETFVYKLTEYHQGNGNIKYDIACKENENGCMDETDLSGVTRIDDREFEFYNAHCFKIAVPQIGPAQAIYYNVADLKKCCEHI